MVAPFRRCIPLGISIGEIDGFPPWSLFQSKKELSTAGVQGALQAGIVGGAAKSAESNVVSGEQVDDKDFGTTLYWYAQGGQKTVCR